MVDTVALYVPTPMIIAFYDLMLYLAPDESNSSPTANWSSTVVTSPGDFD